MTCQHVLLISGAEVPAGGGLVQREFEEPCGKPVLTYRTCGTGSAVVCKKTLAYCDTHGGDSRAKEEMREHHKEHTP